MELKCIINGVEYGNSLVQGITFTEEYNETLDSGTIIINGISQMIDLKPYDDVYIFNSTNFDDYFTAKEEHEKPCKHLLVDDYSEELINIDSKIYRYTINLMSETKKLEVIQLPNTSITQPLNFDKKRSVWAYLEQYVQQYSPTLKVAISSDKWVYKRKYTLDNSLKAIFENVYCPDFTLNAPSLKDILTQLMLVKDTIPYVEDDVIKGLDISKRKGTFNFDTNAITNVVGSMSSSNYANNLKRGYSNALSQRQSTRRIEYMGFRNSDDALLTLENMRLETSFPIYKINKIYMCYYRTGEVKQVGGISYTPPKYKTFLCKQDITDLVLLNSTRNLLSKDWNDFTSTEPTREELSKYKLCTLGYDIGSKYITGFGTKYEYPVGWWGKSTTKTYIENILLQLDRLSPYGIYDYGYIAKEGDLYENEYFELLDLKTDYDSPASNFTLNLKTLLFKVDYNSLYNGAVVHSKEEDYRDDITINDNSSSSLTLLEKDGLFQKEKLNRFGNKAIQINATYTDINNLQDLGSVYDDDIVIYHREYSINDKCVMATYYGTKDYVLKNYFTSVYAKHRTYNLMSYGESVNRAENRKMYINLSKDTTYYEKTNIIDFKVFSEDYLKLLFSAFIPSERYITIGNRQTPNKINAGFISKTNTKRELIETKSNYILNGCKVVVRDSNIQRPITYEDIGLFVKSNGLDFKALWKDYKNNFNPRDMTSYNPFDNGEAIGIDNFNNQTQDMDGNVEWVNNYQFITLNKFDLRGLYDACNTPNMEGSNLKITILTSVLDVRDTNGVAINIVGETITELTMAYTDHTTSTWSGFETLKTINLPYDKEISGIVVKMSKPLDRGDYQFYFTAIEQEPIGWFFLDFTFNKNNNLLKYSSKMEYTTFDGEIPKIELKGNGKILDISNIDKDTRIETLSMEFVDPRWNGNLNFYSLVPANIGDKYLCDVNGFVSGYSLCFNLAMYDNVSMGSYIKEFEPTNVLQDVKKDFTGSVQSWNFIVDDRETGFAKELGFYVSHIDNKDYLLDEVVDGTIGLDGIYEERLFNMPLVNEATSNPKFNNLLGNSFILNKDNKETIDMTLQLEPITNDRNILFSQWLMKLSDLLSTYEKNDSDYTTNEDSGQSYYDINANVKYITYNGMPLILLELKDTDWNNLDKTKTNLSIKSSEIAFSHKFQSINEVDMINYYSIKLNQIKSMTSDVITINARQKLSLTIDNIGTQKINTNDNAIIGFHKITKLGETEVPSGKVWFANLFLTFNQTATLYEDAKIIYKDNGATITPTRRFYNFKTAKDMNNTQDINAIAYNQALNIASGGVIEKHNKNMFVLTSDEPLKKTLVYDEYGIEDTTFTSKLDKSTLVSDKIYYYVDKTKNIPTIKISLDGVANTTKSLQYWYLDEDSKSYNFVFGVNITQEDITKGYIEIYLSTISSKDIRVFNDNHEVVGYITNYNKSTKEYGKEQYFDLK